MRKVVSAVIAAIMSLIILVATLSASAAVPTSFTYAPSPVVQGVPTVFDATALPCTPGPCSYEWSWSFRNGTRTLTGGQMGRTSVVTYTFDAFAASKSFVIVTLTVGQGRVGPRQTYQQSFAVG